LLRWFRSNRYPVIETLFDIWIIAFRVAAPVPLVPIVPIVNLWFCVCLSDVFSLNVYDWWRIATTISKAITTIIGRIITTIT
jgi:hypothetical protein